MVSTVPDGAILDAVEPADVFDSIDEEGDVDGRRTVSIHGVFDPNGTVPDLDRVKSKVVGDIARKVTVSVDDEDIEGCLIEGETITTFVTMAGVSAAREAASSFEDADEAGRVTLSGCRLIDVADAITESRDTSITHFTGYRTPTDEDNRRSVSYWGNDAGDVLHEMRSVFNTRPTGVRIAGEAWSCDVKGSGTVIHSSGSIVESWRVLNRMAESVVSIVDGIRTGGPKESESQVFDRTYDVVVPWSISSSVEFDSSSVDVLERMLASDRWGLSVSEFRRNSGGSFDAEVIDTKRYSRTNVRGVGERIRVYPSDELGVGTQLRIHACVEDCLGTICEAGEVQDRS